MRSGAESAGDEHRQFSILRQGAKTLTGIALRTLRIALGIPQTSLARELGLTPQAVAAAEQAKRLKPLTESAYTQAMARLARRASVERQRQVTRELLELAD